MKVFELIFGKLMGYTAATRIGGELYKQITPDGQIDKRPDALKIKLLSCLPDMRGWPYDKKLKKQRGLRELCFFRAYTRDRV